MTERSRAVRVAATEALTIVGRIRQCWPWLAESAVPGPVAYVERTLSDAAKVKLDRLVVAERAERVQLTRDGLTPAPATLAPARVGVLDAREVVKSSLDDVAWRFSSSLRRREGMAYRQVGRTTDERVTAALDYCGMALHHVAELVVVEDAVRALDTADRVARAAAGAGADQRLVKAECPACGRRATLRADVGSPIVDEWSISCIRPECRCRGIGCPCNRPDRYPGARHLWPRRAWPQLGRLLGRQEVTV